jgi:hypothetical protein
VSQLSGKYVFTTWMGLLVLLQGYVAPTPHSLSLDLLYLDYTQQNTDSMSVMLETSLGDLIIDLETERCPRTCENFLKLCKMKYYALNAFFNGTSVFRSPHIGV